MSDARPSILIADDTPENLELLGYLLGGDYKIFLAATGQEAVALALAHSPDLILMDVLMPGMDGFEACRQIKADVRTADIPVIFVTAIDQDAEETRGLELGAIDFISKPFSPRMVRVRIQNHMKLKQQRDLLGRLSFLDGMTGISNRRRFDQVLDMEWRRHIRSRSPLSLIMMDIDFFKAFNDTTGHLQGDDCLRKVAQAVAGLFQRPGDLGARYGGEEFVGVLPETDTTGALRVAGHVQEALAALALPHPCSGVSPYVTLSMGVAGCIPESAMAAESLIQNADRALYQAKAAGRNRIVLDGASPPLKE
jgi:diguanylate cyclase (GGDEF)-like protein